MTAVNEMLAVDALTVKPKRASYRRLVLISVPRHLDGFDPAAPADLIVATEWLAWREARARGFDAVHFECADPSWPAADAGPPLDLAPRGTGWVWAGEVDPTVYRDVSLGRLYSTYLSIAWHAAATLRHGLLRLCRDLRPEQLVLFDLSAPYDVLTAAAKRAIAADAAAAVDAEVDDRLDPPAATENALPFLQGCMTPKPARPPGLKDRLREWVAGRVEALFRLHLLARRRRPRVFFYISLLSLRHLVDGFDGRGIVPVIPFGPSPKTRSFLTTCWRGGIWPVAMEAAGSDGKRRAEEARIIAAMEAHWRSHPTAGLEAVQRETVRSSLFRPGILTSLMALVDQLAHLLDRLRIDRVVTGDSGSPLGRAMCELALARGIPADETLNGVFVLPFRNAPRCGDRSMPATVTRELAQGPGSERWLNDQGARIERVVTGYPALGRPQPGPLAPPKLRHGLILPGYAWSNDMETTRSRIISSLVETVRMMADLGFTGIRLKLHPSKDVVGFYRHLVERLDLPCEVHAGGSFEQHVAWADVVVGPVGSSTFLETVAGGKPYYVMRPLPSTITADLLPGAVIVDDAAQLAGALKSGIVPDRDRLLGHLCGLGVVGDPVAATWDAIIAAAQVRDLMLLTR
ncbi:MAG: hypothetical protein Q7R40_13070 [Phaeospirillum sp.]|nr:hypothetical protein [Phaeospirillum sp.]